MEWQLREIGGAVSKSAPKDGSYRVLDLPPFLADVTLWAADNRRPTCHCPLSTGRPACKGDAHPAELPVPRPQRRPPPPIQLRRPLPHPAAEEPYPAYKGVRRPVCITAEPWPGISDPQGATRKAKAADIADGVWPNLIGKHAPCNVGEAEPAS